MIENAGDLSLLSIAVQDKRSRSKSPKGLIRKYL